MLKVAAVGNTVSKADFKEAEPTLRLELVNMQYELRDADFPVVVVVAGDDRIAANALVNRLNEWMDSRFIRTHVFSTIRPDEAERPLFWRLWRAMPPEGGAAIWAGGLFRQVVRYLEGETSDLELETWARHVRLLQDQLIADGALVIKFFLHTPAKDQRKRLKKAKKDPTHGWWVDERDWASVEHLENGIGTLERVLRETTTATSAWNVVEATDGRYRDLTVARTLLETVSARLASGPMAAEDPAGERAPLTSTPPASVLAAVDLGQSLDREAYRSALAKEQAKLHRLADQAHERGISTVLAFEGWDAGGKGGAIRRITQSLEAGTYDVRSVAAPSAEERAHHYLWRFWRDLPRAGDFVIYDRTWYGRLLVERVEGFAQPHEWGRAFEEIVDFEEQLVERGNVLAKFWLHISPEEQLARFQAREGTPYKQHKITEEDYRNRERWDDYVEAIGDMVLRTSTDVAPWTLVAAEDKYYARIQVLKTVNKALKKRLRQPD